MGKSEKSETNLFAPYFQRDSLWKTPRKPYGVARFAGRGSFTGDAPRQTPGRQSGVVDPI